MHFRTPNCHSTPQRTSSGVVICGLQKASDTAVDAFEPCAVSHAGGRLLELLFVQGHNSGVVLPCQVKLLLWADTNVGGVPAAVAAVAQSRRENAFPESTAQLHATLSG
jgi:hypothetical protein